MIAINPFAKAAIGAILIGLGGAVMISAQRELIALDHEGQTPEQVATEVAEASADLQGTTPVEMTAEAAGEVVT